MHSFSPVVVGLAAMAGETERAGRLQRGDGALCMALVAGLVRIDRRRVRLDDFRRPVTGCAVPSCGMVVLVTRGAFRHRWFGLEAHSDRVALYACQVRMLLMLEGDFARARKLPRHRYRHGHQVRMRQLGRLVAGRALARGRPLVVADLAPARRLERQLARRRRCRVAGDAGESAMGFDGRRYRREAVSRSHRSPGGSSQRRPAPLALVERPGSMSRMLCCNALVVSNGIGGRTCLPPLRTDSWQPVQSLASTRAAWGAWQV